MKERDVLVLTMSRVRRRGLGGGDLATTALGVRRWFVAGEKSSNEPAYDGDGGMARSEANCLYGVLETEWFPLPEN